MFALYIISAINGLVVRGCIFQAFWVGSKPVRSNFFIFFFQEKSVFFGKNRYLSEKSAIFLRFFHTRFFHPKIFFNITEIRFFAEKSTEIGDFLIDYIFFVFYIPIKYEIRKKNG